MANEKISQLNTIATDSILTTAATVIEQNNLNYQVTSSQLKTISNTAPTITGNASFTGSVVIGSPTGGAQGNGTLNSTGLYINGVAVDPGGAGSVTITNDTTTNATMYLMWVTTTTGDLPVYVSSSKLSFNPSTSTLTATTFSGNADTATVLKTARLINNTSFNGSENITLPYILNSVTVATGFFTQMVSNNIYYSNNSDRATFTLPVSSNVGDIIEIDGIGAGGWRIAQNANQYINIGPYFTSVGITGRLDSSSQFDSITLRCVVQNLVWNAICTVGNITTF